MLEYLDKLSPELKERRITLITNVRAGSSSFYTAYRSLCEEFTRHALRAGGFHIEAESRISLVLSRTEVIEYFSDLGTEEKATEKIKNYILKINKHIHEKEKPFDEDLVVKYISALYHFTAPFAAASGISTEAPEEDAIRAVCNTHGDVESARAEVMRKSEQMFTEIKDTIDDRFQTIDDKMQRMQSSLDSFIERENEDRKKREREDEIKRKVEEDILKRERLRKEREKAAAALRDEQKRREENARLQEYRTQNIIQTAPKYFSYLKGVLPYKIAKAVLIVFTALSLLIPILYYQILYSKIDYLPFFFFGIIFWEILMVILLIKTLMTTEIQPCSKAINLFPTGVMPISQSEFIPDGLNVKYKIAAIIASVSLVFDALLVSDAYVNTIKAEEALDAFMIVFTILIIALMIATCIFTAKYYTNYSIILYRGKIGSGNTYIEQNVINVMGHLIDEQTFVKKMRDGRPIVYPDKLD